MVPGAPTVLHVDLDAFFAAVEVLDDPGLAGRPVIVGGTGDRGVVAACTYEARAYGVRSAMPSARARRLCPSAVFLPGRYARYAELSRRFHQLLLEVTPLVEGIALDEAFLDVAGARRLLGPPEAIARRLRERIAGELGLAASVGVASTKLVAKLASEAAKPRAELRGTPVVRPGRGVVAVEAGEELAFLHPHPVRALWGVGPRTHERLERFGVRTVGDLAALPPATLVGAVGPAFGRQLHDLAWGRDPRPVEPSRPARSIGHEETYGRDLSSPEDLHREAVKLCDGVAARLRRAGLAGRTVTLKVRFGDFRTITRSRTVAVAVADGPRLAALATGLLAAVDVGPGVRLLGVSVANLAPAATQLRLGELAGKGGGGRPDEVARAVGAIRDRFGEEAIGPAALLGPEGLELRRTGASPWGPRGRDGTGPARC